MATTPSPPDAPNAPDAPGLTPGSSSAEAGLAPTPLLLVVIGDSPRQPSGLGRLARDLGEFLAARALPLQYDLVQFGWEDLGADFDYQPAWKFVPFAHLGGDWAASALRPLVDREVARRGFAPSQVVVFHLWDPSRCFPYATWPFWKWGYFAIDGHNPRGTIGGPAGEVICHWNQALAYTRYGALIMGTVREKPVPWLPHGLWWHHLPGQPVSNALPPLRLGCVAANQARKDLGLFFAALAELRRRNPEWRGWLHTDALVTSAWSIPELLAIWEIPLEALDITFRLNDQELAREYQACRATLAPGRGEGFGYPIVESLACGVPCLHMDYAGGAELLPSQWRLEWLPDSLDDTNPYSIGRPRLRPLAVVHAVEVINWDYWLAASAGPRLTRVYCHGLAQPYYWPELAPRWDTWLTDNLAQLRVDIQRRVAAAALEADPRD